jgi:mannose/fructose/N-acetylgalactosamine-specific phosphotransferase system component IIB
VSDALRSDPARAELYLFAAPEGARAVVLSVDEALLPGTRATIESERAFLLFPGPDEPLRLREGGFPLEELNVGGLHFTEGKRAVLPYVYLDARDRESLLRLAALGVRLVAQDLPTNPPRRLEPLLGEAA